MSSEGKKRYCFSLHEFRNEGFFMFIKESEVIDVHCRGKRYSWFKSDERVMSRIGRFLLSDVLIER